jgi:hypothetical protein
MAETPVKSAAPAEMLIARYPAFKGLVNGNAEDMAKLVSEFGQDLVDLLLAVVADGKKEPENRQFDFQSAAGLQAWDARFASTSYYQTTSKTEREFELKAETDKTQEVGDLSDQLAASYGDLRLSKETFDKIAGQALRRGYQLGSISLEHLVYSEASLTPSETMQGASAIAGTSAVNDLMTIAKNYSYAPTDLQKQIVSVLTGQPVNGVVMTKDSFENMARQQAIGMYGHLRERIESGSSLEDIFSGYRNRIAATLEMDPKSIQLSNPLYARVLGSAETGQMSLADVDTLIKTDERYKYHMTKKANKDSMSIGTALLRMFGEVK